jgi:DNA repair protein RecO (recombination protein O)
MKNLTAQFIILGNKNFGEFDKLIFLYCKELGKIKVIAKGARKITSKFIGHLETLNFCNASLYFGPKNIILREISTEQNYLKNNFHLPAIENALKIAEITNKTLFENQTLDDLEKLISEALKHLKIPEKESLIKIAYMIKLLDKAGQVPDFKTLETKLEQKYLKFFTFVKERPFREIKNIQLQKNEEAKIENLISRLANF